MKIEINEHGTIVLKEVFNPIKLVTSENEFYDLKKGELKKYSKK